MLYTGKAPFNYKIIMCIPSRLLIKAGQPHHSHAAPMSLYSMLEYNVYRQESSRIVVGHICILLRHCINDRIATQRHLTPKIPIGSRVMSRTTSAPTGGRARKVVAVIAGCRSFRTFRDCHASIEFTTVGAQPNLTRMFGQIWDRFEPKEI